MLIIIRASCFNMMMMKWVRPIIHPWRPLTLSVGVVEGYPVRVILILVFEFFCLGHTYKLFHFVHWFQNCFRFRSRTLRSSGGKFFVTLVDLEGEKRQKKAKFQNWLKTHPKLRNA